MAPDQHSTRSANACPLIAAAGGSVFKHQSVSRKAGNDATTNDRNKNDRRCNTNATADVGHAVGTRFQMEDGACHEKQAYGQVPSDCASY
jgi:hypothetical protein